MATAGIYNISADQGSTFARQLTWKDKNSNPVNITNYTARMQVRVTRMSDDIILSLTTENNRIALGGSAGTVNLTVSAADMTNVVPGQYFYDLELVSSGGVVTRLLKGTFKVSAEVTR